MEIKVFRGQSITLLMLKFFTLNRNLLFLTIGLFVISRFGANDPHTWLLEVIPILIIFPIIIYTHKSFRLTSLLYKLIFIHAVILMIGAHYTYELVPLGEWMKNIFGFTRNNYDRIGHFAQGFIPAIFAREIIKRKLILPKGWLFLFVTSICLAFSASFELFEWFISVLEGSKADSFLGTQGDIWDTQWDMFLCLIGAIISQLVLGAKHDRELGRLGISI